MAPKNGNSPVNAPAALLEQCTACKASPDHKKPCAAVSAILASGGLAGTTITEVKQLPCFFVLCQSFCGARNANGECQALGAITAPSTVSGWEALAVKTTLARMLPGCEGEV